MAAAKTADTSDCTSGAINGICIGMVFLCMVFLHTLSYRLVTAFTGASAQVWHTSVYVQWYRTVTELLQRLWPYLLAF